MIGRPLRVGVAGLGFGAAVHVPGLRGLSGVEVVAIAGSTRDRAAIVAERLSVPNACAGIEELLEQRLDAVTLALPPPLTEAAAGLALDRGLAVLSEKPLADTAAAAERLAARAVGRTTAVDFQFGELAMFRALKVAIDSGRLGTVRRVAVLWIVQSYAHRQGVWSWKLDADHGGGVLTMLGAHFFYLVEWLFGPCLLRNAKLSHAASAPLAPAGARVAEDMAELELVGHDGLQITALLSNGQPRAAMHQWEVTGDRGRATLANQSLDYVAGFNLAIDGVSAAVEAAAAQGDGRLQPFQSLAQRFITAVRDGSPVAPGFSAGARVQSLIGEAKASE